MPTTFAQEDTSSCFGVDCNRQPDYRVITLTADGIVDGERVGGIGVSLLCKECLVREHSFNELGEPIFYGDKSLPGPADVGILVLPLHLTKTQVGEIREEITEEIPIKKPV